MKQISGVLFVDKPSGVTSHDVVKRVRRLLPKKTKVGHAGTLDPLASGLLILLVGRATRFSEYFLKLDKCYLVTGTFGFVSNTYDIDGKLKPVECEKVEEEELLHTLDNFLGEIEQVPPPFSAVRIKGRRAYELARKGKNVQLSPRRVKVHSLKLLSFSYPNFTLEVCCSSGTYIRSLVHDIGKAVNCGAVVSALRRISVGSFSVEQAVPLLEIESRGINGFLKPIGDVLPLPPLEIAGSLKERFLHGAVLRVSGVGDGLYKVFSCGEFLGVGEVSNGRLKPKKVYLAL